MSKPTEAHILVVDEDRGTRRLLQTALADHDFEVEAVGSGREALDRSGSGSARLDLVLLDPALPDVDGLEVIHRVRAQDDVPIIVLSARTAEQEKVAALDSGADDYITKPFGMEELAARIRVWLRRSLRASQGDAIFRTGDLEVDLARRRVCLKGEELRLTPKEYELLAVFVSVPNRTFTSRELLRRVWGGAYGSELRYVRVYVERLRKKLGDKGSSPQYLVTQWGVEYRLVTRRKP